MGILRKYFARKPERQHLTYTVYLFRVGEYANYSNRQLLPTLSQVATDDICNIGSTIQAQHTNEQVMVWCANEKAHYREAAAILAEKFGADNVSIAPQLIIDAVKPGSVNPTSHNPMPSDFGNQLRTAAERDGITTHLIVMDGYTSERIVTLTQSAMGHLPRTIKMHLARSYQIKFRSRYRGAPLKRLR